MSSSHNTGGNDVQTGWDESCGGKTSRQRYTALWESGFMATCVIVCIGVSKTKSVHGVHPKSFALGSVLRDSLHSTSIHPLPQAHTHTHTHTHTLTHTETNEHIKTYIPRLH